MITVRHVGEEERDIWDAFVGQCPGGSFYHLYGWRLINERSLGHRGFYLAAFDGAGAIVGVFPLVYIDSRLFGKIFCSLPFVNYGGPCARQPEVQGLLLEEAARIMRDERGAFLEVRAAGPLPTELQALTHKVSMTIALERDPEVLWKAFSTDQRKTIRRAEKNGFTLRVGGEECIDDFYAVLSESWRNLGTPLYAKSYFREVARAFPEVVKVFNLYHRELPVATALCGYHRGIVEGMWNGMTVAARALNPNYFLYWAMIKHGCEAGYDAFHLGRSSVDSGGEQFKRKWNAHPHQLYWYYVLGSRRTTPELRPDNPKFLMARRIWRRLPPAACARIGPMIARVIP